MCSEREADQNAHAPAVKLTTLSKTQTKRPAWNGVADVTPITGRNAMTKQPVKAIQALDADCEDVLQGLCCLRGCFRAMPGGLGLLSPLLRRCT